MMTSKDYIKLAKHFNSFWSELEPDSKEDSNFWIMVNDVCYDLEEGNPRFDKGRFLTAVTKEGE
jgi:hypothetical protein